MTPVIKMPIASHGFPNRSGDLELAEPGSLWFLEENGEVHSSSILWKYETCQHEGFLKPCLHMFAYVCIPNSHDPKMGPTLQVLVSSGLENEVSTQGAALGAMDMMEKLIFQKRHNCQANQTDVIHPPRCTSSDPSEMRSKGCENRPSSKDSFGTFLCTNQFRVVDFYEPNLEDLLEAYRKFQGLQFPKANLIQGLFCFIVRYLVGCLLQFTLEHLFHTREAIDGSTV